MDAVPVTSRNNAYPIVWMRLKAFCDLRGESEDSVKARIKKGQWLEGRHHTVKNRRIYVNVPEADRWVESESL